MNREKLNSENLPADGEAGGWDELATVEFEGDSEIEVKPWSELDAQDEPKILEQKPYQLTPEDIARAEHMKKLDREVFDEVDLREAMETVAKFGEKLDSQKLLEFRNMMREDYEIGAMKFGEYLTELLELKDKPDIIYRTGMGSDRMGECQAREGGDLIRINAEWANAHNVQDQMETIAHEYWHSRQHMLSGTEDGTVDYDRGEMYQFNFMYYVNPETDMVGYRKQLVEVEARMFGSYARGKLNKFETSPKELREQVFENVDQVAIQQEVGKYLDKFDEKEFLAAVGKESFAEFSEAEFAEMLPGMAKYLGGMLGLRKLEAVELSELEEGTGSDVKYPDRTIFLGKSEVEEGAFDDLLGLLADAMWQFHQHEVIDGEYCSRGELYNFNFRNFVNFRDDMDGFWGQLVKAEPNTFATGFLEILDKSKRKEKSWGGKIKKLFGKLGK